MRIRKARSQDIPAAVALAKSLDLDVPGLASDPVWVAEENGAVAGLVALRKHTDALELYALGVDASHRGEGVGKALVGALVAETPADMHLATVIPEFFEVLGFVRVKDIPRSFLEKRKTSWCEGCDPRRCAVMVRKQT